MATCCVCYDNLRTEASRLGCWLSDSLKAYTHMNLHIHIYASPSHPIPRLRRFVPTVWQAGLRPAPRMAAGPDAACLGWTNSNPPTPHVLQCLVHVDCIVYVLMLLRCFFPVPRLYSLQEHSLGVAFFSSPLLMSCCIFPKIGADYSSHGSILLPKHIPCV